MGRARQQPLPGARTVVDEVGAFTRFVRLARTDRRSARPRVYTLRWETPLFEARTLVRSYGPQGTEGRVLARTFADEDAARREIHRLLRRRLQRGYQVVEWE
jgi:predicted DNA-binding WGR domain protein